jgi:hypothetical protein
VKSRRSTLPTQLRQAQTTPCSSLHLPTNLRVSRTMSSIRALISLRRRLNEQKTGKHVTPCSFLRQPPCRQHGKRPKATPVTKKSLSGLVLGFAESPTLYHDKPKESVVRCRSRRPLRAQSNTSLETRLIGDAALRHSKERLSSLHEIVSWYLINQISLQFGLTTIVEINSNYFMRNLFHAKSR